jgi:hypothetical protein
MKLWAKGSTIVLVALCIIPLFALQQIHVMAQSSNSAPVIEWQQEYGDYHTEAVSNLIQTSDGGYAFLDLGFSHSMSFVASTLYKTDSLGNVQWDRYLSYFSAIALIETSDKGFEVSGNWNYYPTGGKIPTLLKTDSAGNIQWAKNFTGEPPSLNIPPPRVLTSDNSSIFLQSELNPIGNRPSTSITETDSEGNIKWQINATFAYYGFKTPPVDLSTLIETSDGSIAALGVGRPYSRPEWEGNIFLVKTEGFLPTPSSTELPTPLPTAITPSNLVPLFCTFVFIIIIISLFAILTLTLYRRHRKTTKA